MADVVRRARALAPGVLVRALRAPAPRGLAGRARAADPAAAGRWAAWQESARAFLTRVPAGWEQPAPIAALLRANKTVPGASPLVTPDGAVSTAKALARGETLRVTLPPEPGPLAALRVEAFPPAEAPNPETLTRARAAAAITVAVAVRAASGKERKVPVAFADANAKAPRYRDGAELHGIGAGWKLPAPRPAEPLVGVWLFDGPVTLASGETLEITVTGETTVPMRFSTSPFGAARPLDVAPAALAAARAAELAAVNTVSAALSSELELNSLIYLVGEHALHCLWNAFSREWSDCNWLNARSCGV